MSKTRATDSKPKVSTHSGLPADDLVDLAHERLQKALVMLAYLEDYLRSSGTNKILSPETAAMHAYSDIEAAYSKLGEYQSMGSQQ